MASRIEIPDELAARVIAAASARGLSAEALVIEAIEAFLAREPRPAALPPRRLALAGIGESEDGLLSQRDPFGDL